jgi:pimeloyl-ACP methyl ester carboxylesterase
MRTIQAGGAVRRNSAIYQLRWLLSAAIYCCASGWNFCGSITPVALQESGHAVAPALPAPTGPFAVGRKTFDWLSPGNAAEPPQRILVYVWYPADPAPSVRPAKYFPEWEPLRRAIGEDALKDELSNAYSVMGEVKANALADAPVAAGRESYPVLLFAHGLREKSIFYSALLEDLASHGFVVVGIDRTRDGLGVAFPDGKIQLFDEGWLKTRPRPRDDPQGSDRFQIANADAGAKGAMFVIDQLTELNRSAGREGFKDRLDLSQIGVLGHSNGGRIAARTAELDQRVKACMNLDGWDNGRPFLSDRPGGGPSQPFMVLGGNHTGRSDRRNGPDAAARQFLANFMSSMASRTYWGIIMGFEHSDCTDIPLLASAGEPKLLQQKLRMIEVTRAYVLAFFEAQLRGRHSPLLDGPSAKYPEVALQSFQPRR